MNDFEWLFKPWVESETAAIREHVDRLCNKHDDDVRRLAAENWELKFRLGLLVRLLIDKGIMSAQEYAELLAEMNGLSTPTSGGEPIDPTAITARASGG